MKYIKNQIRTNMARTDSIAFRYLATVIVIVFITEITFGMYQIQQISNQQMADLESKAQTQSQFLASVSPENIFFGNFLPLEALMHQAAENQDIVYSVIVNNEGQALTRYLNRDDEYVIEVIVSDEQTDILALINTIKKNDDIVEIQTPIISEGIVLGEVRLGYSNKNVNDRIYASKVRTILSSLLVTILISILTVGIFYLGITRPLGEVIRTTQSFASGNLDRRMQAIRNSEIDQLKKSFNQMANALQESIQEIETQKEEARKLAFVAKNTDNMVIISDSDGNIEWVNDAFVKTTGYTREEVIGKRPGALLQGPKSDPVVAEYMRHQLQIQKGFRAELINYNKAGVEYWVELEVQPVYNQVNFMTNFIAIESDITKRKISDMKLKSYAQELERSNQDLQEFAYVASHDLQEPLRKIQAFGSRLSDQYSEKLDEKGMDYLQRMVNAAERMQNLIISLLDFSRVATQVNPFMPTDLTSLINEVLEDLEVRIEESNATVIVDKLITIDADRLQMRQLFQNLISNALKFVNEENLPLIQISHREQLDNFVEIRIKDNGIGLDEKYADRIFGVFQRLHGKNKYSGTGVGLAICRKIISRHSGTISVESKIGRGTTFIISLPKYQLANNQFSTQEFPNE